MRKRLPFVYALAMLLMVTLAGATLQAVDATAAEAGQAGRVVVPTPPKGIGDKCVADTEFMRRYHMTVLNHQRDDTVHNGIRTKQFSLQECITCHAVNGPDARPVTADNPQHFCRSCHDYAAVKVDCFECHASRPQADKAAQNPAATNEKPIRSLAEYLGSVRQ